MAGKNYFGLLRQRLSTAKLADMSGIPAEDIKHFMTTGELEKKDHRKFKLLWKITEKRREQVRDWRCVCNSKGI